MYNFIYINNKILLKIINVLINYLFINLYKSSYIFFGKEFVFLDLLISSLSCASYIFTDFGKQNKYSKPTILERRTVTQRFSHVRIKICHTATFLAHTITAL